MIPAQNRLAAPITLKSFRTQIFLESNMVGRKVLTQVGFEVFGELAMTFHIRQTRFVSEVKLYRNSFLLYEFGALNRSRRRVATQVRAIPNCEPPDGTIWRRSSAASQTQTEGDCYEQGAHLVSNNLGHFSGVTFTTGPVARHPADNEGKIAAPRSESPRMQISRTSFQK
jgi:hypothetical protein